MRVPSELIQPYVDRYLKEHEMTDEELSLAMGYESQTLRRSLARPDFSFNMADRVLCKMGANGAWRTEPLDYYYWNGNIPPDMSKPVKCARETCDKWFELDSEAGESGRMSIKRFCSTSCQNTDAAWRRGEAQPRHRKCRNGHDREKAGVYLFKTKGKVYRRCRACHLAARARSYRKNEKPRREAVAA